MCPDILQGLQGLQAEPLMLLILTVHLYICSQAFQEFVAGWELSAHSEVLPPLSHQRAINGTQT